MKARLVVTSAMVLAVSAGGVASAQKRATKCSDVPIEVSIVATTDGVLSMDKATPYTDGVDGVYNTVIHICGTGPSYDATMGLITSRRSLRFAFPAPIPGSEIYGPAPAWAGSAFYAKPFMNVRKILWGRLNHISTFTTRMGFSYINGPGDKSDYAIQFPGVSNDAGVPPTAGSNEPNDTVAAIVQDVAGTCRQVPGGTLDSWIVTVSGTPAVGVLMKDTQSGSLPSGQYAMPFTLLIKARSCVPF